MTDDQERLKLKIAKKAYVFEVRRKFAASRNFAVKKKPETPAEDLKEKFKDFVGKKKPIDGGNGGRKEAPLAPAKGMGPIKIAAIAAVLFLLGMIALLFLLPPGGAGALAAQENAGFSGSYDFSVEETGVLTVGGDAAPQHTGYFLVGYAASNLSSLNFTAKLYSQKPSSQVFILDYPRDSGNSYPVFRRQLSDALSKSGMTANEIGIENALELPSGAILIVPTGYFPKELLGTGSENDYRRLLARGVTIIYIGLPFDNQAMGRDGLTVAVNHGAVLFDRKVKPKSTDGFGLFNAQYSASPAQTQNSELSSGGMLYGSISVIRHKGGTLLLLPQSLDGGWRERDYSGNWNEKGELAAQDVARLINEEKWLPEIARASSAAQPGKKGEQRLSLFSGPFSPESAYVRLSADAVDLSGGRRQSSEVFKIEKTQKGKMVPSEPETVPYYLSGQRTRLNVALRESSPKPVKLYVEMYKDGELLQKSDLEPGLTNPTTDKSVDIEVDAEPGNYIVLVADEGGKVYAACELVVADLEVTVNESNWAKGKFSFFLSSAGQAVEPRSLSVSLDGKGEARYTPSSLGVENGRTVVTYQYADKIESGAHRFLFTAGGHTKALELSYDRTPPFWENPIVIVLAILAAGTFGIGWVLRRPESVRYGLDVPDFPPMSTIKIPVKRETVLDIFESVNAGYAWQRMPLRADEIKNGFRKLTYNGKPILVGDFNLERILAKLMDEGLVKEEAGYYGLARWEKESRHSVHYLAIYRIMRNVFVNSAVKFSKLDAMSDCDMKAIAGNEEIYLHIMEAPEEAVVHRALATAKKGSTIIVFKTPEARDSFRASLTSTSKLAVGLKMEVDGGRIMLFAVKNEISSYLKGVIR